MTTGDAGALPERILVPHPDRFAPGEPGYEEAVARHTAACVRGDDGYLDPISGYWVFTARFLDERGFCCERGCRHCPWVERP